ncbi:hypothetical protein BDY21DRAFT_26935 [Lineolata rhizophorae]|uniref:Uncharacterized protein n=1 Tax=Lineolata rhizophorae TaxID=578093 RepID=A0A6A6P0X1_9PEZI|nr:hypothetical protein BDY21DRAFT_26935 [Lineolata rhizophorae]
MSSKSSTPGPALAHPHSAPTQQRRHPPTIDPFTAIPTLAATAPSTRSPDQHVRQSASLPGMDRDTPTIPFWAVPHRTQTSELFFFFWRPSSAFTNSLRPAVTRQGPCRNTDSARSSRPRASRRLGRGWRLQLSAPTVRPASAFSPHRLTPTRAPPLPSPPFPPRILFFALPFRLHDKSTPAIRRCLLPFSPPSPCRLNEAREKKRAGFGRYSRPVLFARFRGPKARHTCIRLSGGASCKLQTAANCKLQCSGPRSSPGCLLLFASPLDPLFLFLGFVFFFFLPQRRCGQPPCSTLARGGASMVLGLLNWRHLAFATDGCLRQLPAWCGGGPSQIVRGSAVIGPPPPSSWGILSRVGSL